MRLCRTVCTQAGARLRRKRRHTAAAAAQVCSAVEVAHMPLVVQLREGAQPHTAGATSVVCNTTRVARFPPPYPHTYAALKSLSAQPYNIPASTAGVVSW